MHTQAEVKTEPGQSSDIRAQVEALIGDEPEGVKADLERAVREVEAGEGSGSVSAGRIGMRYGGVSELTMIIPFKPGGADRLRGILKLLHGTFTATDRVGTVHDMRFVFLDNDTKLLFATAYDGDWDPYIDDFATKIPDELDLLFAGQEGWPGIRSPEAKDWIANHQVAAEGWYVANPDLSVADTRRAKRIGQAVDEFLDRIGG
jgi:hypothetical protein